MGRGLGTTQKRLLDAVETSGVNGLTVTRIATQLEIHPRQARRAVYALRDRGHLYTSLIHAGFNGWGEYGPLHLLGWLEDTGKHTGKWVGGYGWGPDARSAAMITPAGDRAPDGRVYRVDTRWLRSGMPTGLSLCAWTIEVAADVLEARALLLDGIPPTWSPAYYVDRRLGPTVWDFGKLQSVVRGITV